MTIELSFAWLMLLGLGVFHGLNPGMGWLFAVGLGLQEQQRSAVWRALLPLALGHALAIGAAVLVVLLIGTTISTHVLKWAVAGTLLVFGIYRLVRHRHPRYGGMQMRPRDLTVWSFLMASAHGAGLMVLPFVFAPIEQAVHHHGHPVALAAEPMAAPESIHAAHVGLLSSLPPEPLTGVLVTLIHTAGYLLIMGALAVVVYEKLGLRLLRKAWINLDLIWAAVLILTAILTPLL